MGIGDNIIVNNFMFCLEHGMEFCYRCGCDHRMVNDVQIEDDLADLSDMALSIENRGSFNVYALGAVIVAQTKESYQCARHKSVDCRKCFDWVKMIKEEFKEEIEEWARYVERWEAERKLDGQES